MTDSGNGEHPDVVQHAAAAKRPHVVGIEIQPATERRGVVGHPVAMALGVSVARFDHRSERACSALYPHRVVELAHTGSAGDRTGDDTEERLQRPSPSRMPFILRSTSFLR